MSVSDFDPGFFTADSIRDRLYENQNYLLHFVLSAVTD